MAYKDEYEVARLHANTGFAEKIAGMFEGDYKIKFHLAPPLLAKRDANGHLQKREYGPLMMQVFRGLAALRFLRGTPFDVFGYTEERRTERELIDDYRNTIGAMLSSLSPANLADVIALASIPEDIRGYGHVKQRTLAAALEKQEKLLQRLGKAGGTDRHAA